MKLNFLIAPDFAPERFAGWHMLNTVLQRRSGLGLHLLTPGDAEEQATCLVKDEVDLVYANPFDATAMIQSQGYIPIARPKHHYDEMVIASGTCTELQSVEGLQPGCRIALTSNRDVKLIGLRLLEPADLDDSSVEWVDVETYQAAARMAIKGEVQAAFFLADAFNSLTRLTRGKLTVLVESRISDISHVVLAHPRVEAVIPRILDALICIGQTASDASVLEALGLPNGFEPMSRDDADFMIDLMDTLLD
jgi:phosphonate transport system substrate-binding protein